MKKVSPYSFWGRVFKNWHIKLLSLLLATVVYVVCFYSLDSGRKVQIPLRVVESANYEAVSNIPEFVTLNITGNSEAVYLVDADKVTAVLDLSQIKTEGIHTIRVSLSYDSGVMKKDVFDISVNPLTVRAKFEKR